MKNKKQLMVDFLVSLQGYYREQLFLYPIINFKNFLS